MQVNERLFCHWDLVRFVKESHLQKEDGTFLLLSVTDGNQLELMIFLGKGDSNSGYEVRVYKNEPSDNYVHNQYDNVNHYEENDKYAVFFFNDYTSALNFTKSISYAHPEYKKRPVRQINLKDISLP